MTLRQRVAEACGWSKAEIQAALVVSGLQNKLRKLPRRESFSGLELSGKIEVAERAPYYRGTLPPFDTSHDAILPAILRTFTDPLSRSTFAAHLLRIVGHDIFSLATATAEQLCRAFLGAAKQIQKEQE